MKLLQDEKYSVGSYLRLALKNFVVLCASILAFCLTFGAVEFIASWSQKTADTSAVGTIAVVLVYISLIVVALLRIRVSSSKRLLP